MADNDKPAAPAADDTTSLVVGHTKIPTSFAVAVIGALVTGVCGVGGAAHGQFRAGQLEDKVKQLEDKVAQMEPNRLDIVEMKTDIKWIKEKLSEDDRPSRGSRRAP